MDIGTKRIHEVSARFGRDIQLFMSTYPVLIHLWSGIVLGSFTIAFLTTAYSTILTRRAVSGPLLTGVVTLFTISLTIATMGVQVASSRYSYRIDTFVLRPWPITIHFSPHLLAVGAGIFILSTNLYSDINFFVFIFASSSSVLSIFPFLLWLLQSITPEQVLLATINEVDTNFLNQVADKTRDEYDRRRDDQYENTIRFLNDIRYIHITDDDPVDSFTDIVRSRINDDDTVTTKRLLNEYIVHIEPLIEDQYFDFRYSHTDSQHVSHYVYGPFEEIFQLALKNNNHIVTIEVIILLRESVRVWREKLVRGMPEVFFRTFSAVAVEYMPKCDDKQAHFVASEYSTLAKIIADDIRSPSHKIGNAMISTFVSSAQNSAIIAIDNQYYRSASVIVNSLRSIVESILRKPSGQADRELVAIGLIGVKFAQERAQSTQIVHIANDVSTTNEAERTITTLVTFKDKVEEYGNDYAFQDRHIDKIMQEVNRINMALEERDLEIASEACESGEFGDKKLVVDVIRASRLFRSSFVPSDLKEEIDNSLTEDKIKSICDALHDVGKLSKRQDGTYSSS